MLNTVYTYIVCLDLIHCIAYIYIYIHTCRITANYIPAVWLKATDCVPGERRRTLIFKLVVLGWDVNIVACHSRF